MKYIKTKKTCSIRYNNQTLCVILYVDEFDNDLPRSGMYYQGRLVAIFDTRHHRLVYSDQADSIIKYYLEDKDPEGIKISNNIEKA